MYHDIIRFFPKTRERIFEVCFPLYEQGHSLREIERQTGFAKSSIKTAINERGLVLRNAAKRQVSKEKRPESMRPGVTPYGFCYLEGKLVVDTRARDCPADHEMVALGKRLFCHHGLTQSPADPHANG